MRKQAGNFRKGVIDLRHYADYLESLLEESPHHRNVDFRASRPSDYDGLLDVEPEHNDPIDQGSDASESDPTVKAICIPPQIIQVCQDIFVIIHECSIIVTSIIKVVKPRFPPLAEDPNRTYVLQVDGVEKTLTSYNPDLDWSRYLAPDVPLDRRLDRQSHDKCVIPYLSCNYQGPSSLAVL